jgi:hypothetical protein
MGGRMDCPIMGWPMRIGMGIGICNGIAMGMGIDTTTPCITGAMPMPITGTVVHGPAMFA